MLREEEEAVQGYSVLVHYMMNEHVIKLRILTRVDEGNSQLSLDIERGIDRRRNDKPTREQTGNMCCASGGLRLPGPFARGPASQPPRRAGASDWAARGGGPATWCRAIGEEEGWSGVELGVRSPPVPSNYFVPPPRGPRGKRGWPASISNRSSQ